LQHFGDADHVTRMHYLGYEYGVRHGVAGGDENFGAPGRLERVDACITTSGTRGTCVRSASTAGRSA
jgi:hypothetical protein